ncbi:unnamed protein product [Strongylus vulgaris]|uniref:Neurotransmitter-gated ion-channel ligand-binding domain-containing protein n=1 Tax=Strongylus vulgaris TaxID=40348 RepID=A0A3P7L7Y4_STRVU|nr:unnamed protein product [Strongylus vulgaris]
MFACLGLSLAIFYVVESNRYAEQLYEDLLYYYNKNVRPDEVNQVLTTNLWLEMQWFDYKLSWDPARWGGIRKLHIPSDQIWIPDILLYNNADGEPHISILSDALVYHNGLIVWKPPSIYKSFCPINIEYFPYDSQSCTLKFGGWKWDLMSLTSQRHEQLYPGCCGQDFYIDVTFDISLRRKTLFYTVNLVIPCMLIGYIAKVNFACKEHFSAILTTFVFYIPPIEHKMTFSISILVSLTVFYLVLIELIPPTSLVLPLIGRYLLFTMFLVAISIFLSVLSLNYYRRDGSAHPMPHWIQVVFVETLPKYIGIKKAEEEEVSDRGSSTTDVGQFLDSSRRPSPYFLTVPAGMNEEEKNKTRGELNKMRLSQLAHLRGLHPDLIRRMIDNVSFIADHFRAMKKEDKRALAIENRSDFYCAEPPLKIILIEILLSNQISSDWSYVANVIDRLVLIIFTMVNLVGTILIIQNSPMLFDHTQPMKIVCFYEDI